MPHESFLERFNNITYFLSHNCNAPWTVYFETALPAAGQAAWELFVPETDDIIRGYARPGPARSHRHFRKRKKGKGGKGFRGIPELGDEIGKRLPGAEQMRNRPVTAGVRNLWIIDGLIQRALWYWLVAEVTTDFFHNWLSALHKTEFCQGSGFGAALSQSFGEVNWFAVGNQWTSPAINNKMYEEGFAFAWSGAHTNGGFPFEWSCSASVIPNPILPGGTFEMRHWDPFRNQWSVHEAEEDGEGRLNVVMHGHSLGDSVIIMYRTNGGGFLGNGTQFTIGKHPL